MEVEAASGYGAEHTKEWKVIYCSDYDESCWQ